jgi:hypothetical protein
MKEFILHIQKNNGFTDEKSVLAESSVQAVNNNLDGEWVKMSNNELPRGTYPSGTYSYERGYVTVKKPNRVFDWFKRVK